MRDDGEDKDDNDQVGGRSSLTKFGEEEEGMEEGDLRGRRVKGGEG